MHTPYDIPFRILVIASDAIDGDELDLTLRGLAARGVAVRAAIGDPDPLQAIVDGLRVFPADELMLVTHPEKEELWAEPDLLDRARDRFPDLTIVHLVAGPRRLLDVEDLVAAA